MSNRRRILIDRGPKGPKDNEIWYTSTDGNIITPSGYTILSNTYSGGIGKIVTSGKITSVPDLAWRNKSTLSSIQYKWENITYIGYRCFVGCSNLSELIIDNITPPGNRLDTSSGGGLPSITQIYVPDTAVDAYKAASGWSFFASRIHPMSELPTT